MVYQSTITFTLDTICPWTYISLTRLLKALEQISEKAPTEEIPAIKTQLKVRPYQLYPAFPLDTPAAKREWYTTSYFKGDASKTEKYEIVMTHLFEQEGTLKAFNFDGEVGNTVHAHRVLQVIQADPKYGADHALKVLLSLYRQYFCEARPPASRETLEAAMNEAGVETGDVQRLLGGEEEVGMEETKELLAETRRDGVDSVPVVVFEGRRRDIELVGAREVGEYVKALERIAKESR